MTLSQSLYTKYKVLQYITSVHRKAMLSHKQKILQGAPLPLKGLVNLKSNQFEHIWLTVGLFLQSRSKIEQFAHFIWKYVDHRLTQSRTIDLSKLNTVITEYFLYKIIISLPNQCCSHTYANMVAKRVTNAIRRQSQWSQNIRRCL